ncbi:MAG: diaminopimelate epimerase [Fusobacteriaceae bacterium]
MKFTKMHGAGNDFILLHDSNDSFIDVSKLAIRMCHRKFGIGGDGLMTYGKSLVADIKMNFYNSDGSRASMCGNGIRCFAKFVYDNKIVTSNTINVETDDGIKHIVINVVGNEKEQIIDVDMGYPSFKSKDIPVTSKEEKFILKELEIDGIKIEISSIHMGVPHTVIYLKDYENIDLNSIGKKIENLEIFEKKTNVNFVKILDEKNIEVRTWERGVGRTLACGTGCCSSVILGNYLGYLKSQVKVITEGGELLISVDKNFKTLMSGTAVTVFTGEFIF